MFKDNKLRLLMSLVGFSRIGDHHDPDATWLVPSSLTSTQLQEAVDLIRKYEFDPPIYEDGKGPEDFLRSKAAAARQSSRRVEYDDDSDGKDDDDSARDPGEYGADRPTSRKPNGTKKRLTQRKRARTPVELDDEEMNRRAEARRKRELEKQAEVWKSTIFVHDSDDEDWDAEKDAKFFAREEALRQEMLADLKTRLVLGSTEAASSKKRKADEPTKKSKRRKSPPKKRTGPFNDSDEDDDEIMADAASINSSRAHSVDATDTVEDDETTDTPLSSHHVAAAPIDDDTPQRPNSTATKDKGVSSVEASDDDEDEDVPVIVRRPAARNTRAGFVIDSDSE